MHKLSVSDLHLCQHCPRLFGYACKGSQNTWNVGHKGSGNLPGRMFHLFAEKVLQDIVKDIHRRNDFVQILKSSPSDVVVPIRGFIKDEFFIPYLSEYAPQLSCNQIEAFAGACDKWISYLSGFISPHLKDTCDLEALIATIFHSMEYTMSSDFTCDDGEVVRIRGRPDALIFDPGSKEPVVLEV